ncbi:hypothetical protein FIBSPDRAFT_966385 [Athelia psychrophila]|uniref:Uncharacterized protein n=1 Tax=Athelia psychrophila TaxID=1759441 RepID=A0A167WUT4_9AGAM|nr:hypothetical protein FIBSPDRAFT_966385 [Fibularhizoctonia sp. CBS 109695]
MSDLSKGERYTNLDYDTAAELAVLSSEIVISYDTTCQAARATASHAAASHVAASQADASQATASQAAASQADVS